MVLQPFLFQDNGRQNSVGNQFKGQRVPGEPADVDGDDIQKMVQFSGVSLQKGKILKVVRTGGGGQPLTGATLQQEWRIAGEIKTPLFPQIVEDGFQPLARFLFCAFDQKYPLISS